MDKFLLAENPMRDNGSICIVHMLQPISIIICYEGHVDFQDKIFNHFQYTNPDGILEEYTLVVYHLFTTDFLTTPEDMALPMLNRAWRWYRSYLEWEDKNIDNAYDNSN